jgi:cytochrome P450
MPAESGARRPEGPRGLRGRLAFASFGRDPLGFIAQLARTYPGAARLPMPGGALIYLLDPEAIGEVLLDRERLFTKDWNTRALGAVLGQGLFTSEGELWRRQRGLVAPPLARKQIGPYVEIVARRTQAFIDGIRDGEVRDVRPDMTRLTMEIVSEALFGADISAAVGRVAAALEDALSAFETLIYTWRRLIPARFDQPVRQRLRTASAVLDGVVLELIQNRRATAPSPPSTDLLSRLLAARDEGGAGMTDQHLRDELVTMLLAGHETTAMALSFAFGFLARDRAAAARLHAEAIEVLKGDPATPDVPRLTWADATFKETLRLRPPVWLFGREATRDCVVGGWQIRRGEQVLVAPWLMHHDPRWFPRPTEFSPGRWSEGLEQGLPRHVYLPFGGGQRICAGLHLATMEGAVILAMTARALEWTDEDQAEPVLNAAITLRPKHPLRLRFRRRSERP